MSANPCGCDPTHVPPHWCAECEPNVGNYVVTATVVIEAPSVPLAEQVVEGIFHKRGLKVLILASPA